MDIMRTRLCLISYLSMHIEVPYNYIGNCNRGSISDFHQTIARAKIKRDKKIKNERTLVKNIGMLSPMPPQLSRFRVKQVNTLGATIYSVRL